MVLEWLGRAAGRPDLGAVRERLLAHDLDEALALAAAVSAPGAWSGQPFGGWDAARSRLYAWDAESPRLARRQLAILGRPVGSGRGVQQYAPTVGGAPRSHRVSSDPGPGRDCPLPTAHCPLVPPGPDYLTAVLGSRQPGLVDRVRATIGAGLSLRLGLAEIGRLIEAELAGTAFDLPGLTEYVEVLRQTDRPVEQWWDPAWRRLVGRPSARPSRRQRLAILAETVAMAAVNQARLEAYASRAVDPGRYRGVAIARVPSHHCPACAWESTRYRFDELDQLPALPAHPGCRCRYVRW